MKYVIIRKHDGAILAKPTRVGFEVQWMLFGVRYAPVVTPWEFETKAGAARALDMQVGKKHAKVVPAQAVTLAAAA